MVEETANHPFLEAFTYPEPEHEHTSSTTSIADYYFEYKGVPINERRVVPCHWGKEPYDWVTSGLQYHKDSTEYRLAISMGLVGYDLYCEEGYFVIGGCQDGDLDRLLFFIDKLKG